MFLNATTNPPLAPGLYPALLSRQVGPSPTQCMLFPCGALFSAGGWWVAPYSPLPFSRPRINLAVAWYLPTWRPGISASLLPAYEEAQEAWQALGTRQIVTVEADHTGILWRSCIGSKCVTARSGQELADLMRHLHR